MCSTLRCCTTLKAINIIPKREVCTFLMLLVQGQERTTCRLPPYDARDSDNAKPQLEPKADFLGAKSRLKYFAGEIGVCGDTTRLNL
jgi:hypothetical protein